MPFFLHPDGNCFYLDWVKDRKEISDRIEKGDRYFGTLGGAILHGGVEATSFDQPIKAEPVYDTAAALARPAGAPLGKPVGTRAHYRIDVHQGRLHHPPLWPSAVGAPQ